MTDVVIRHLLFDRLYLEAEAGSDGGGDLADDGVEVAVGRPVHAQLSAADVVDCLIVHHEGAVT